MKTRDYYVLTTLFPLLGHLEDQHGEFLGSWMAYVDFEEFLNLIKYSLWSEINFETRKKVHRPFLYKERVPFPYTLNV